MRELGLVTTLRRYPVKSMLGEELAEAVLTTSGVDKDRLLALIDLETGRVASAKQPRLWRQLLQCTAGWDGEPLAITLPDGRSIRVTDRDVDATLSQMVGRRVRLSDTRSKGAALARPAPEDVIEQGADADVPYEMLEIGQGTLGEYVRRLRSGAPDHYQHG